MKKILCLLLVLILLIISTGCGTIKIYIGEDAISAIEETEQSTSSGEVSASDETDSEESKNLIDEIIDEVLPETVTPSIEYDDKVFTTYMVLEQEDKDYLKETCYYGARTWENICELVEKSGYKLVSDGRKREDYVLTFMQIKNEGSSSNGIKIGDSYEKVFEKFPMANISLDVGMNLTSYYGTPIKMPNFDIEKWDPSYGKYELFVYIYGGKAYSQEEYIDEFLWRGSELPEDYEYRKTRCAFDTYVIEYFIEDGKVTTIMIGNCVGAVNGQ